MQLGQGCRKRTPWWCWLAMIAAGALTLPGAALTIADEPETHPVQPVDLEDETAETDVFVPQPKPAPLTKRIDKKERAAFEVRSGSLRLFSDSMLEVNTNATAGTARAVEFKGSGLKMELGSEKGPKLQAKADRVKIVAHPALGVPVVSKVPHVDPLFKQLELPGAWIQLEGKVAALVPKGTSPDPDDFLISLRTDKLIIIDAPADNADQKAGIFRNRQLRLEGHVEILVNGKQTSAVRCREAAITLAKHKKGTWKPVRMLFVGDASLMRGDEKNGERITAKSILVYGDNSKIEVSGRITGDSSVRAVPPPKRDVTFKPAEYPAPPPPPKVVRRTPFFTETIENGQRVIRSNWPVPFVHREPLKKAARETTAKPPEDWEELKTRKKSNKDFTVVVYHVGNLVVPMPQALDRIGGKRDGAAERVLKEVEYFQPLVKLIKGVIAPKTWDTAGGEGIIVPETTTLSLVVRQTQKVHKAIAELLQELRRLQDVQVTLEIRVIDVPDTDPLYVKMSVQLETDGLSQSAVVLRESTARSFLTAAQDANRVDVFHVGKVTVFSGHGAELKMSRKSAGKRNSIGKLQFVSAVSKDRRSVRLSVAVDASDALDALANATTARVPDGQTLLIDVDELDARKTGLLGVLTDKNVDRAVRRISSGIHRKVFLLVTPRIVIQEEEEERMGAARAKPRFSSGSQGTVIGTVTPRIIIQEEEEELLGIEFSASAPKPEDKPKR